MKDRGGKSGLRLVGLIVLAAHLSLLPTFAATSAQAQEVIERRSILQMLFGKPRLRVREEFRPPVEAPRKPRKKSITGATPATTAADAAPAVVKAPDARKILVVGDFMAKALGDGLDTAFTTATDVVIEIRVNGSSGLVRKDFYDWSAELPAMIDEVKPAVVILMLGANDRQQMTLADKKEKFRSDPWKAEYQNRVLALASIARDRKIPLLWVGLPPFMSSSMTADAATLNGVYRVQVEKAGGEFVDIWEGFVDANGKFVVTGSDINGQSVRLRGSDGLSLTKAGRRKLAFYVEKPIRHLIGNPAAASLLLGAPATVPGQTRIPETVAIISTPPINLSDPELDGSAMLMDAGMLPPASGKTPRDLLVDKGDIGVAPDGRVDDFRMRHPVGPR